MAYRIGLPNQWWIHNIFHVHLLTKMKLDMIPGHPPVPEPPVQVNDKDEFVIEKFVNSWWFRGHFQFKVRWQGYEEEHDEWSYLEDMHEGQDAGLEQLVQDYQDCFPLAPQPDDPPHCHAPSPPCRSLLTNPSPSPPPPCLFNIPP